MSILSIDVTVAVILMLLTAAALSSSLQTQSQKLSQSLYFQETARASILAADYLLKNCEKENGLSKCDEEYAYSHVLSQSAIESLGKTPIKKFKQLLGLSGNAELRIKVLDLQGNSFLEYGDDLKETRVCVRRIALLGSESGEAVFLEACAA